MAALESLPLPTTSGPGSRRKVLRRETRSIAEWRSKGKFKPFEIESADFLTLKSPERAATWHGSAWSSSSAVSVGGWTDGEKESVCSDQLFEEDEYTSKKTGSSSSGVGDWVKAVVGGGGCADGGNVLTADDYFSIPRSSIPDDVADMSMLKDNMENKLRSEKYVDDTPKSDSSSRRAIEVERRPLVTQAMKENVQVADTVESPTKTSSSPPLPPVKREINVPAPPSPEDIIEIQMPLSRTVTRYSSKHQLRSGEVTPPHQSHDPASRKPSMSSVESHVHQPSRPFTPPPAPLPEMLIPDTPGTREPTPPATPRDGFFDPGVKSDAEELCQLDRIIEEKPELVVEKQELVVEKQEPVVDKQELMVEKPEPMEEKSDVLNVKTSLPVTEIPQSPTEEPIEVIYSSQEDLIDLNTLVPPPPKSEPRSDEGYLSGGETDSEDEHSSWSNGVVLPPSFPPTNYNSNPPIDDAPLPEDIISLQRPPAVEADDEYYQHHCTIHGHFFPKVGPLRSVGYLSGEPFFPYISCDRCGKDRLTEAWQCSLLSDCGIVVCTLCHDFLEGGVKVQEVEEKVDVYEEGLVRGVKIGFEVGLAGKAKEIASRMEREVVPGRRSSAVEKQLGVNSKDVKGYRGWEAPRGLRRMLSLE